MLHLRSCGFLAASLAIAGCSIHPLPKNVTRDTTVVIVNKIRCEARDALIEIIKKVLMQTREATAHDKNTNLILLRQIEAGQTSPAFFCNLRNSQVGKSASRHFKRFVTNSIAYSFKFDITENKVKKGALQFSMPFTKGNLSLKLGAGADKSRQNVRKFEVSDSFSGLVTGNDGTDEVLRCDENYPTPRNQSRKHWVYPITGKIGLDEYIDTYVELVNAKTGIPSLSDDLKFTTVIDASANPKVTLSGIPSKKLRLSEAEITYSAKRTDVHQVTLTLTKPAPAKRTAFSPIAGAEKIYGMPAGLELGFAVKTYKKPSTGDLIEGCAIFGEDSSPFVISNEESQRAKDAGILESRRRDFIDTSKELRESVGR